LKQHIRSSRRRVIGKNCAVIAEKDRTAEKIDYEAARNNRERSFFGWFVQTEGRR